MSELQTPNTPLCTASSWLRMYHLWNSVELFFLQVFRGTITDAQDFDPCADAETLYNAMKGIGECLPPPWLLVTKAKMSPFTQKLWQWYSQRSVSVTEMKVVETISLCPSGSDKDAILDLVTSRSNAQRQEIIAAYKSSFGQVQECIIIITSLIHVF